jgi:hypothetical protein
VRALVRSLSAVGLLIAMVGCAGANLATPPAETATTRPVATATPSPCPTPGGTVPNVSSVPGDFPELDPGTTYWVDPDDDPCTSLRVLYTIPAAGWLAWIGTFKNEDGAPVGAPERRVGVSIATVTNLVVDGCTDHTLADPPVGPTVDDLATALTNLGPFQVTSPPRDVTIDGYHGTHLELSLPEMDVTACRDDEVISWDAEVLAYPFHGYLPRDIEEYWILDVEGSRLVIVANRSPDSAPEDLAERQAVLDSIQIEP